MAVAPNSNFIGLGLRFPFEIASAQGGLSLSTSASISEGINRINQSLQQILGTAIGERYFNRDFGSRLFELVFEPNDLILIGMAQKYAREAILKWEHRIHLGPIRASTDNDKSILYVNVQYRLRENNAEGNLVFPFFLS